MKMPRRSWLRWRVDALVFCSFRGEVEVLRGVPRRIPWACEPPSLPAGHMPLTAIPRTRAVFPARRLIVEYEMEVSENDGHHGQYL